jgi:ribosome production factor 2
LEEAGPRLALEIRRLHQAPPELMRDALKQPRLGKVKQKNVGFDSLEGKVGRIYLPKQDLGTIALAKSKGVKRQKHEAAAERKEKRKAPRTEGAETPAGSLAETLAP